jgi:hypothetical protein
MPAVDRHRQFAPCVAHHAETVGMKSAVVGESLGADEDRRLANRACCAKRVEINLVLLGVAEVSDEVGMRRRAGLQGFED